MKSLLTISRLERQPGAPEMQELDFNHRLPERQEQARRLLGRKVAGFPIALPIRLQAEAEDRRTSELQYYLILDLATEPLLAEIRKLDKAAAEQARKLAANRPPPAPQQPAGTSDRDEVARLEQKIEALEARIDLMTRQLAEVLDRLPERKPTDE